MRKFCSNSTLLQMTINGQETLEETTPNCEKELYGSSNLDCGQSALTGERKVLRVCWDLTTDELIMSLEDALCSITH